MPPAPQPPKNKRDFNWGRASKSIAFWALLLLIPVALIQLSSNRGGESPEISYAPQYRAERDRGNISKVTIREGKYIQGEFKSTVLVEGRPVKKFTVNLPAKDSEQEIQALLSQNVTVQSQDQRISIGAWIIQFLPWLLLIG